MIVSPSGFEHKKWWRNLLSGADFGVLRDGKWTSAIGHVLSPQSPGYPAARTAYQRRWPRFAVDRRAPFVTVTLD